MNKSTRIANGHKRISEQRGDEKSEWHYIIQWRSNTFFRFTRIRQNEQDLLFWNKDKEYTKYNERRDEAIHTKFT